MITAIWGLFTEGEVRLIRRVSIGKSRGISMPGWGSSIWWWRFRGGLMGFVIDYFLLSIFYLKACFVVKKVVVGLVFCFTLFGFVGIMLVR